MSQTCQRCGRIVDRACQSDTETSDCPELRKKGRSIHRRLAFAESYKRRDPTGWAPHHSWPDQFKPASHWREQLEKLERSDR